MAYETGSTTFTISWNQERYIHTGIMTAVVSLTLGKCAFYLQHRFLEHQFGKKSSIDT